VADDQVLARPLRDIEITSLMLTPEAMDGLLLYISTVVVACCRCSVLELFDCPVNDRGGHRDGAGQRHDESPFRSFIILVAMIPPIIAPVAPPTAAPCVVRC